MITIKTNILLCLGNISYYIYLTHELIRSIMSDINLPSYIWILCMIILTIISAIILDKISKITKKFKEFGSNEKQKMLENVLKKIIQDIIWLKR